MVGSADFPIWEALASHGTLGYWDSALGLCRSLYPTDEPFWAAAENFRPEGHAEQYRDRITLARKEGLPIFEQRFLRLELRLRRLIDQTALAFTPDELKVGEEASRAEATRQ
jgi:hypothetical protein